MSDVPDDIRETVARIGLTDRNEWRETVTAALMAERRAAMGRARDLISAYPDAYHALDAAIRRGTP